jgi:hypothetical protein
MKDNEKLKQFVMATFLLIKMEGKTMVMILKVCEVPISWKSKGQTAVSLSITETEYSALSETFREVKFVKKILDTMRVAYDKPINVSVDNIGAIFMVGNRSSSERSKHIGLK